MSCVTDGRETWLTPLAGVGILVASVVCLSGGFVLLSQSHAAAHQTSQPGEIVHPVPIAPPAIPAIAAVAAPSPIATTAAISSTVLRSERIASLRVFGVTVFRYDTKVEGPRK